MYVYVCVCKRKVSPLFDSPISPLVFLIKATTEFEDLIASLKISKESQQIPPPPAPQQATTGQSDGPLSPQSFAMVSTEARTGWDDSRVLVMHQQIHEENLLEELED